MWELPSDGIMILFNNEHNRFMVRMLSPFFHESTRGFGVVLVVLVLLSLSFSDVGFGLGREAEMAESRARWSGELQKG